MDILYSDLSCDRFSHLSVDGVQWTVSILRASLFSGLCSPYADLQMWYGNPKDPNFGFQSKQICLRTRLKMVEQDQNLESRAQDISPLRCFQVGISNTPIANSLRTL